MKTTMITKLIALSLFFIVNQSLADDSGLIAVTGYGEVSAVPDRAQISAGVDVRSKDSVEAMKQNAQKMSDLMKVLDEQEIDEKDIKTSNFSINPVYDYSNNNNNELPQLLGYDVRNQLNIINIEIDQLGKLINEMTQAGSTNINSISFVVSNEEELLKQARINAIKNATMKAKEYADAAGVELGDVISIKEHSVNDFSGPVVAMSSKRNFEYDSTPIAAGESQLSAQIDVVFSID